MITSYITNIDVDGSTTLQSGNGSFYAATTTCTCKWALYIKETFDYTENDHRKSVPQLGLLQLYNALEIDVEKIDELGEKQRIPIRTLPLPYTKLK